MGYQHKRKPCAEEAKETLENVLKVEGTEYALIEAAETFHIPNPTQDILKNEAVTNVLPDKTDELLREETDKKVEVSAPTADEIDTVKEHETSVNVDFQLDLEKDGYHKNRKGKNLLKLGYDCEKS